MLLVELQSHRLPTEENDTLDKATDPFLIPFISHIYAQCIWSLYIPTCPLLTSLHPSIIAFTCFDKVRIQVIVSICNHEFSSDVSNYCEAYLLNTLSTSEDIAGIDKIFHTINARIGYFDLLAFQ